MNKIEKVLIPFDFSDSAKNALNYAINFSKPAEKTQIHLVHVKPIDLGKDANEKIENELDLIIAEYATRDAGLTITRSVEYGDFVENIIKKQTKENFDLIIMGTKGGNEISQTGITNSSNLVLEADCPVIIIPKTYTEFGLENITLAIDNKEIEDSKSLMILLVIARRFNAKIHVLTVYNENDPEYLSERLSERTLEYYFEKYYAHSSTAVSKHIAQGIMDYDKKESIDMLAILPKNHASDSNHTQGKLAEFFTMNTEIPLLTID